MHKLLSQRQGLRVTVRLYDTVVAQRVHWQPRFGAGTPFLVGPEVPTPSGKHLALCRWSSGGAVEIQAHEPTAETGRIETGERWGWSSGGVSVDLDLVPRKPAQRTSKEAWGDVALLVLMLTLMAGVGQVNYLLRQLTGVMPTHETAYEPTPELIARLLQRDYQGEEGGRLLRADRPDAQRTAPSFYLPAGHEGSWQTAGGGSNVGDEVIRGQDQDDEVPLAEALRPKPRKEARDVVETEVRDLVEDPDAMPVGARPVVKVEVKLEEEVEVPLAKPIERFIGWGFRDWFDVADGRKEQNQRIARILERTRVRLKINPNDPHAIQTAAYYAYLSENHELVEALNDRFIDLYPEDPSGYNNLALTYKRTGEYEREEALYRKALVIDPMDTHVMNNLAVNLAHQGRYDEALRLMAALEEMTPGDPYADLHRAKIFAAMGKKGQSFKHLRKALAHVEDLDTLHHIEFRQDIRLDPAFDTLRAKPRFRRILEREYGAEAEPLIGTAQNRGKRREVRDG